MTKELVADTSVDLEALRDRHTKTRKHHRYQPARACAVHVVEVVTREQFALVEVLPCASRHRSLFSLYASFAFRDFVHELLEDEQAGVASNTAAI